MSGRCLRSNNRSSSTEGPVECMVNMSAQKFKLGEIIWCKINGGSWWPAQVVDESCVAFKPKSKKKDQILVRLYGTFEHMYVETTNCISKTEKIYGEENRSNREIFEKALEEDLSRMRSGRRSDARVSKSFENVKEKDKAFREKDKAFREKGQRKRNLKRAMIEANSPLVHSSDNPKAAKKAKLVVRPLRSGTRGETFKDGNAEKSGTEDAAEMQNSDACTTKILDAKDLKRSKNIKRLVAKIVREVEAENARNEALKVKGKENYPGKIEYVKTSKKESHKMEVLQLHIPGKMENQDTDVPVSGDIDDTRAINDTHFHQQTKPNDSSTEVDMAKLIEPDVAINGDQSVKAVTDGTRKTNIPEEIDELSPRRTRIMQNLGLIAPLGSPFCRNGSNQSFLPLVSRLH